MMLDLRTLNDFPARVIVEDDASHLDFAADGVTVLGRARAELNIMPGDHIYYCNGLVACDTYMECARCLESFRSELRGDIDFSIHELSEGQEIDRDELPENELLVPDLAAEIDITAPVREALMLALPLKPLCRDDCLGLCPLCGVNRNEHKCDCKPEKTDSRWDGLRDLLK